MTLSVLGTILFTNGVIWGANALLLILDATGKPSFLLRYKVQEEKQVPVSILSNMPFNTSDFSKFFS